MTLVSCNVSATTFTLRIACWNLKKKAVQAPMTFPPTTRVWLHRPSGITQRPTALSSNGKLHTWGSTWKRCNELLVCFCLATTSLKESLCMREEEAPSNQHL